MSNEFRIKIERLNRRSVTAMRAFKTNRYPFLTYTYIYCPHPVLSIYRLYGTVYEWVRDDMWGKDMRETKPNESRSNTKLNLYNCTKLDQKQLFNYMFCIMCIFAYFYGKNSGPIKLSIQHTYALHPCYSRSEER